MDTLKIAGASQPDMLWEDRPGAYPSAIFWFRTI